MKPAPSDYIRPATLDEACSLIAGDDDARLIAGGQTLVPMMAMRLARPARLIDIARLSPSCAASARRTTLSSSAPPLARSEAERSALVAARLPFSRPRCRGWEGARHAHRGTVRRS